MGGNSNVLVDKFNNFFMRRTTIIRNKIISDSSNNVCNISIEAAIMFNGEIFSMFQSISEVGSARL